MRSICGRHRDGCPKPHQFSVPVEYVGIDAPLWPLILKSPVTLCEGDSLTVEDADAGTRFTFTHRGAPQSYTGPEYVVREGWLVLPTGAGALTWNR